MAYPRVTCHQECQDEASHEVPGRSARKLFQVGTQGRRCSAKPTKAHRLKPVLHPYFSAVSLVNIQKVQPSPTYPTQRDCILLKRVPISLEQKEMIRALKRYWLTHISCKVEPTRKQISSKLPLKKYILQNNFTLDA